ncbi:MAG: hypothetical protein ACO1PI_04110 [Bacteroidota bacterium]
MRTIIFKTYFWVICLFAFTDRCRSQPPKDTLYMDSIPMTIIDEIHYSKNDTLFFQNRHFEIDTFLICNIILSKAKKERFKDIPLNPLLFYYKATYNQIPNRNLTLKKITERYGKEKIEFYDPSIIEVRYLGNSELLLYFSFKDFRSVYGKLCSYEAPLNEVLEADSSTFNIDGRKITAYKLSNTNNSAINPLSIKYIYWNNCLGIIAYEYVNGEVWEIMDNSTIFLGSGQN